MVSFVFWIGVGYSLMKGLRWGLCSVCGAVVSVWGLNLVFGFLPSWVTVLLIGQSVVGGANLFRDMTSQTILADVPLRRRMALTKLAWFVFILGGTLVLGLLAAVYGLGQPLDWELLVTLLVLEAALAGAYVFWVLATYWSQTAFDVNFCATCAAVSSVWILNLVLGFLPAWTTVLLIGGSVAGGASAGRDLVTDRFGIDDLEGTWKRIGKQATYFGLIVGFTLGGAALVGLAVPLVGPLA